jgi:hypothetical protein
MSRYNSLSNAYSARSVMPLWAPVSVVGRLVYPEVTPAPVEVLGTARFHDFG